MKKKIGLIGFGSIGVHVFRRIKEEGLMEVGFIFDVDQKKMESVDASLILTSFDDFEKRPVDLVVEAAIPQVIRELGPRILKSTDLLILSLTSLADNDFCQQMDTIAKASGTRIYISHGALVGLDGIYDGREVIETVQITTTKNPKSLAGLVDEGATQSVVVYNGSTRGACEQFPRNVNSHASIALLGIGLDKTRSKIIADPGVNSMTHVIEVIGKGLRWKLEISSIAAAGAITGAYTPESVYQTTRRICVKEAGLQMV